MLGLAAARLPPVAQAWTMNFQWSLGVVRLAALRPVLAWYRRAVSVRVARRSVAADGEHVVYGITRVAFRSRIDATNLFMTAMFCFYLAALLVAAALVAAKALCELVARRGWVAGGRFLDFHTHWRSLLKGALLRLNLLALPLVAVFCLWELTRVDSPAEVVFAAIILGALGSLAWAAAAVVRIARRSAAVHGSPAVVLYSEPKTLAHLGFLYVHLRASAHYFVVPLLAHVFVKAMLVSLAQHAHVAQAVGFVVLEAAMLVAASVLRPWMDKSTNSFNIAIYAVNLVNAVFLFVFTNALHTPPVVVGAVGVALFLLNAIFLLVLLAMVVVSTSVTFFRRNPDALYQPMADDRASFMRSHTHLAKLTELEDLAATARGGRQ